MDKLDNLFFEFVYARTNGEAFAVSADSCVTGEDCYAKRYAQSVIAKCGNGRKMTLSLSLGIPTSVMEAAGEKFAKNEESYALVIDGEKIALYGASHRGLLYAVSTLKQLVEANAVSELVLFDYPDVAIRGYRVYTPGPQSIDAFKAMVDNLVYYKYNSIMIEVGGAMEYKRHPEINTEWVKFCEEVLQSPNEAHRICYETHPQWKKNSIHAENGGGTYISQEQMRDLIAYCRERELEVIPEVPTLSHCDYIVRAHPDIRERWDDTYPDTYCPSNPKSYELVFDILDEIIDVFKPAWMNIGHDECYSLGKCPLCQGKDPVDLYVGDIIKINDYLRARNIKAMMWAEKFFDGVMLLDPDGLYHGYGGIGDPLLDVPKCIGCIGKVPMDITLMHWYWSLCESDQEENLQKMGYPMVFGNFNGAALKNYRGRIGGVSGGFISNWGAFEEEYMQRNGQSFNLMATAWIFWNQDYDTPQAESVRNRVKDALYAKYKSNLGSDILELMHTTPHSRPYKPFHCGRFIIPEEWTIGQHIVTYTDGTEAELPIVYGYNIRTTTDVDNDDCDYTETAPTAFVEVIGASNPEMVEGKLWYRTAYKNPYPEKQIQSIRCEAKDGIEIETKYEL